MLEAALLIIGWIVWRNWPRRAPAGMGECPACRGRVSLAAESCPHCGQPFVIKPNPEMLAAKIIFFLLGLLALAWFLFWR